MMKGINITTDIFDNRKIKQIEKRDDGDTLITIWLHLLTLAGRLDKNGALYLTDDIPFDSKMLSAELDRELSVIETAINVFADYKMITVNNKVINIRNWEKYQGNVVDIVDGDMLAKVKSVVDKWNETQFSSVRRLTAKSIRYKQLSSRINEYGIESVLKAIDTASKSNYLETASWFNFDWFIKPNNFPKVLEGNYNKNVRNSTKLSDRMGAWLNE